MNEIVFKWNVEPTPGEVLVRFGEPAFNPRIQALVGGPLGVPAILAVPKYTVKPQISLPGPLKSPSAQAYSYLLRKADLSITGPLGQPAVGAYSYILRTAQVSVPSPLFSVPTVGVYSYILRTAQVSVPSPLFSVPTLRLKGTNLVEILGITVEWNYSDWAFDISAEWRFTGTEDEFTGELSYTGAFVIGAVEIPFTTTETHYTFGGIPPEVIWELGVRAGLDGPTRIASGVTTREVPAQVMGIEYVSTVDSLTFTWDPSLRADSYRARLYRDGVLLEEQTPVSVAATYTGLEDGSVYVFEVSGINETGPGFAGTRTAITAYIPPTAATNLRQTDQNYVAVKVEWDKPPQKVTFWESEVYIAEPYALVHRGILPPVPLEWFYGLPRAGTDYQWRIRAGNPGGLSAWAEIEISTPGILIDSRLAILPAAYQEDYLFPDTWDGGTDIISEGVGDPEINNARLSISEGRYRFMPGVEGIDPDFNLSIGSFFLAQKLLVYDDKLSPDKNDWSVDFGAQINDFFLIFDPPTPPTDYTDCCNDSHVDFGAQINDFNVVRKLFVYSHHESDHVDFGVTINGFETRLP